MSVFRVDITDSSGNTGTFEGDAGLRYTDLLNDVNEAEINISGSGSIKRALVDIGSTIKIYRNDTLEFHGQIEIIDYLDGGAMKLNCSGYESWLAKEPGTYASSPYQSTASATIAGDIIGESSYFSAGTVEAGTNIDFRISDSSSLLNALGNLIGKTQQDIQYDYANTEIDILDHRGSSSIVAVYNDGLQITNLRVTYGYPQGNSIKVYGKGDGSNQITATTSDATSISNYGTIFKTITDRSITSTGEAQKLANASLAAFKDPTKIYSFAVINPNKSITTGDHLELNSLDKGLSSEEVRVVGMERGRSPGGREFLDLQVTNAAYSAHIKRRNTILARIQKEQRDSDTYMQGSGNTTQYPLAKNANSTYGLRIPFEIDSTYEDEAGNLRISDFLLDFDVDLFNNQYGSVSESSENPALDGATATDLHNHDAADSGHDHSDPSQTSTGAGGAAEEGQDSNNSATIEVQGTSWTNIGTINPDSNNTSGMHIHLDFNKLDEFATAYARMGIRIYSSSTNYFAYTEVVLIRCHNWTGGDVAYGSCHLFIPENTASPTYTIQARYEAGSGAANEDWNFQWSWYTIGQHSHTITKHDVDSDNAAVSDSDKSPGVSGNTVNHDHSVSIGDGVGEAAGPNPNATDVTITVEKWNTGTSTWDVKHTVVPGSIFEEDLDISDSGTYPDSKGWWRIQIKTNSANADLVQGIVKLKHALDN